MLSVWGEAIWSMKTERLYIRFKFGNVERSAWALEGTQIKQEIEEAVHVCVVVFNILQMNFRYFLPKILCLSPNSPLPINNLTCATAEFWEIGSIRF